MLRFLVSGRAIAMHAALLALVVSFGALALWQWDRANTDVQNPRTLPAAPLTELVRPGQSLEPQALGRTVEVQGRYDIEQQWWVGGQRQSGEEGYWVVVPLRTEPGEQVIAVVRGFVTDVDTTPPAPSGTVAVTGVIQPTQDLGAGAGDPFAERDGTRRILTGLSISELVGLWESPLLPGWLAVTAEEPLSAPIERVDASALTFPSNDLRLQNSLYAVQWIAFAAFVVFVYRRLMRDAWEDYRAKHRQSPSIPLEENV